MSKKKTHFDEHIDWQKHQYDLGYYTGSKTHPLIKAERSSKLVAAWCFFQAGVIATYYFLAIFQIKKGEAFSVWGSRLLSKAEAIIIWSLFLGLLFFFSVWIGIRYYQRSKKGKRIRVRKSKTSDSSKTR